jgi:nucleoside-diphosphate-sugar epimerase
VVNAVWLALHRKCGNSFEIYNVSSGTKKYVSEIIKMIQKKLKPIDVSVEYTSGTPGDQHGVYGNNTKINKELGWRPFYDFDEGLSLMIDWAKNDVGGGEVDGEN